MRRRRSRDKGGPAKQRRATARPELADRGDLHPVFTVGPYLAFTKHIPFTSYGYELKATFTNSANIALKSPVRIAGVEVGKVIKTERDGDATTVTFTVDDSGRPIHENAFATIRPRIFLEGNFFIDLDPGSPGSPELESGGTIPISHTSTAVQIDEVLTALQSPVRADLGRLLESYGNALTHEPTAAEDLNQLPQVHGLTGGQALNKAFQYGGEAGKYSSQVTQALTGTEGARPRQARLRHRPHLRRLRRHQEALQGLIDNFDVFTGALANQSENLQTTVHELAPTLQTAHTSLVSLDKSLPPLRTYAIELTPGGRRAARPDQRLETVARPGPPAALRQGGRRHGEAAGRSDAGPGRRGAGGQGSGAAAVQPAQPVHDEGAGPGRRTSRSKTSSAPAARTTATSRACFRTSQAPARTSTATARTFAPRWAAARTSSKNSTRRSNRSLSSINSRARSNRRSASSRSSPARRRPIRRSAAKPTRCPTSTAGPPRSARPA